MPIERKEIARRQPNRTEAGPKSRSNAIGKSRPRGQDPRDRGRSSSRRPIFAHARPRPYSRYWRHQQPRRSGGAPAGEARRDRNHWRRLHGRLRQVRCEVFCPCSGSSRTPVFIATRRRGVTAEQFRQPEATTGTRVRPAAGPRRAPATTGRRSGECDPSWPLCPAVANR